MILTIFKEVIQFCYCWSVYALTSQHRTIMACLKKIVNKSLRYIFLKNGSFKENNNIFFIYNHMKVCSALLSEQQLFRAIRTGMLVPTFSCLDTQC